jgi:hypothetical protein
MDKCLRFISESLMRFESGNVRTAALRFAASCCCVGPVAVALRMVSSLREHAVIPPWRVPHGDQSLVESFDGSVAAQAGDCRNVEHAANVAATSGHEATDSEVRCRG